MLAKVYSAAVYGVDAYEVEIEVNAASGCPVIILAGASAERRQQPETLCSITPPR